MFWNALKKRLSGKHLSLPARPVWESISEAETLSIEAIRGEPEDLLAPRLTKPLHHSAIPEWQHGEIRQIPVHCPFCNQLRLKRFTFFHDFRLSLYGDIIDGGIVSIYCWCPFCEGTEEFRVEGRV